MFRRFRAAAATSLALAALTAAPSALARPVSYPGGWTVMAMNDDAMSSLLVHYSPSADWSVGWRENWARDEDWVFTGAQINRLVRRWNNPGSQANFYIKGALGGVGSEARPLDDLDLGGMVEIAADWETRRWFLSADAVYWNAGDFGDSTQYRARVGVAPYIAEFGGLHTWLMLQATHRPDADDELVLTPLARFFYGTHLWEVGVTDRGEGLFNWIIRF